MTQLTLDDICANRHKGDPCSREANPARYSKREARDKIMRLLENSGGLTLDEVSKAMNVPPNAISGRFTELARGGRIFKSGRARTRSGRSAGIWRVVA